MFTEPDSRVLGHASKGRGLAALTPPLCASHSLWGDQRPTFSAGGGSSSSEPGVSVVPLPRPIPASCQAG